MPKLASLRRLRLVWNGIGEQGARALAASPHLANLRQLDLPNNDPSEAGLLALVRSNRFTRLRSLDLSFSSRSFTESVARTLVESPHFPDLVRLRAKTAYLTQQTCDILQAGLGDRVLLDL